MKYAWIENNMVRDLCSGNPYELFTPEVATFYNTNVLDEVVTGATLVGGNWVNPEPVTPEPVTPTIESIVKVTIPVASPKSTAFNIQLRVEDKATGDLLPSNETYYVPLKNITDSTTVSVLVFPMVDGVADISATLDAVGVYTMLKSQIRPTPVSEIGDASITIF